jgi:predicted nuclease of predicted toxin-antitoxin system
LRFLIDANLPRALCALCRELGYEAVHTRDVGFGGSPDETIATFARDHALTILTTDFDFADIRQFPPSQHHGIVVFVLPRRPNRRKIFALVRRFLAELSEPIEKRLLIVDEERTRVRE